MPSPRSILANTLLITLSILLLAGAGIAQTAAATREYNRLVNLNTALHKIPFGKQDKEPHRSFLKKNDKDIVYSEPAGQWYVRSDRFWDLQKKYRTLAIADKIAWTAAENPLPGECEGFVTCDLYNIRATHGEYLLRYPNGTYSRQALKKMVEYLGSMAEDASGPNKTDRGPVDSADRAEMAKTIKELRDILAKVSRPERTKVLTYLKQIEEGYK